MKSVDTVLITDTETTGLDPNTDLVIEIAAVRFSLKYGSPIETFQALVSGNSNPGSHVNRIPVEILAFGMNSEAVWSSIADMIMRSDCILAHNVSFDRSFIERRIDGIEIPWVCSMRDLDLPEKSDSRKLTEVCLAHGVPVIGAHRALTDVDLLSRLLVRLHERGINLQQLFQDALTPKPLIAALVDYDDRDKAKSAGFAWNATAKRWQRKMTIEAAKKLPFKTKVLEA